MANQSDTVHSMRKFLHFNFNPANKFHYLLNKL